ncbi:hypothetical protein EVG20_g3418 [Dentipellis fragilis]|uniref:Uncharacterized protein n=1 Tax=Dentipellis fragilis TaxID=205917 RepID=A0A4Y9Z4P8_9AGAM|nr:hypothetical protein EVG20_g3418 [Dentipellis fragilis]
MSSHPSPLVPPSLHTLVPHDLTPPSRSTTLSHPLAPRSRCTPSAMPSRAALAHRAISLHRSNGVGEPITAVRTLSTPPALLCVLLLKHRMPSRARTSCSRTPARAQRSLRHLILTIGFSP